MIWTDEVFEWLSRKLINIDTCPTCGTQPTLNYTTSRLYKTQSLEFKCKCKGAIFTETFPAHATAEFVSSLVDEFVSDIWDTLLVDRFVPKLEIQPEPSTGTAIVFPEEWTDLG